MRLRWMPLLALGALAASAGCAGRDPGVLADGQRVELHGTVRNVDGITSRDGARYLVFFLNHPGEGSVIVLAPGRPNLYEGQDIEVRGTFHRTLAVRFPRGSWRGAFGMSRHDQRFHGVIEADPGSLSS